MKKVLSALWCILLVAFCTVSVSAADCAPTDSFTHEILPNGQVKVVTMRPVYEAVETIDARKLGLKEDIGTVTDISADESFNTYILTNTGKVIVFDKEYELLAVYNISEKNGNLCDCSGAKGIYAVSLTEFYISDTEHSRVLQCSNGIVENEILLPESSLIPSDFEFKPVKTVKDSKDYLYVLSEGSYYGALLYDPEGEFTGFFGANTVGNSVINTLQSLWDRLTQNDVKRAKVVKNLPYQFSDICIDEKNFVYTTTGINGNGNTGQIKMLSPGGTNILKGAENFNFGERDLVKRLKNTVTQNFVNVQADGHGFIYALDSTYGLIYIYDTESNMITAFGGGRGLGRQKGVFSSANAMVLCDSKIMVADSLRNNITVFERTKFGNTLLTAQELTLNADYEKAKPLWEEVIRQDSFNSVALAGLAKADFAAGDYSSSMEYAKAANDSVTYSKALKEKQNAYISNHFIWIFPTVILIVAALIAVFVILKKRGIVIVKNYKLRLSLSAAIHPFSTFNEIKYKKLGSVYIACAFTVLYFLSSTVAVIWSDFRYTTFDTSTYSSIFAIIQTVGLILLWTAANWSVSILMQGIGKLKEIFIVTSYSTLPLIIYNLLSTPITHIIASSDSTLISGLKTVAYIFTGIILCVGLMIIHDFSFPKFVFTAVVTVLFMILVVFVLFLAGILLTQFFGFIKTVVLELMQS